MKIQLDLPSSWINTTLGDITIESRYGLNDRAHDDSSGVFYLRISDIDDYGRVKTKGRKYVDHSVDIEKYGLEPGDIVIARSGSVGRSYVHSGSTEPWVFASYLIRFRVNQEIADPRYIGFYLRSPFFWNYVEATSRTVAQPNINSKELARLPIPLPPLSEQRQIIFILQQMENLQSLHSSAQMETQKIIFSLFQHTFGKLPDLAAQWKIVKVEDAGNVQLGRQRAPKYQTGKYTHQYLRVANVYENRLDLSDVLTMDFNPSDFENYKLEYGDILLNEGQSAELVGRPAMWRNEIPNCCFQNTLIRFRAYDNKTHPLYALALFLVYFRSGEFTKISSQTSSVAHLGASRFAQMPFPLPPLDLQREFAAKFEKSNQIAERQTLSNTTLKKLEASLYVHIFTGRITKDWRNDRIDRLNEETAKRDMILGLRGDQIIDVGNHTSERVNQEERNRIERQMASTIKPLLDSLAMSPAIENLHAIQKKQAEDMARIIDSVRMPIIDLQPIYSSVVIDSLARYQAQMASIAESSRRMINQYARAMAPAVEQLNRMLEQVSTQIEAYPPVEHPRHEVARQLSRQQKFLFWYCDHQEGFFTVETIQEKTGLSTDVIRRTLDLFDSLGLIMTVTIPAQSSAGAIYATAYRSLSDESEDEVRLIDLELLEEV